MMFFPIIGIMTGMVGAFSLFTPSYYYRYRWNCFYPIFVIVDLIYGLANAIGCLINFYFLYQAQFSKSAILTYGIAWAIDIADFFWMYMMCNFIFTIYNTPYTIFK